MIQSLASLLAGSALPTVPGLVVKVTILLIAGVVLASLLRRRSAATRHFVWALTLSSTLVLTLMVPIAPKLPIGFWPLPATKTLTEGAASSGAATAVDAPAKSVHSIKAVASTAPTNRDDRWRIPIPSLTKPSTILALWFAGCMSVLLWGLLGHLGLMRLARAALPIDSKKWLALLDDSRVRSGIRRRVRLGRSAAVGAPVTWGWLHPVILLPEEAETWPLGRLQVALQHELAHVARHDYVIRLVAILACAIYWFHPLVWIAARRLRAESEHACDDRVLVEGTPAPDYASHLLEVARGARALRLSGLVAVSMARPSHLEGRLLAVLDEARRRRPISPRARSAIVAALGLVLIPFAGLRPEPGLATASTNGAIAAVASTVAAGRTDAESTFERLVPATPGETLDLDLETGGTVDVHGWDQQRVSVRGRLGGGDWRDTRVVVERMHGGVRVQSTQQGGEHSYTTSHSFEIHVPRRFDVRLRSGGGAVTIEGVEGAFRGQTGGGELVLEHVKGNTRLSTGGGDISVTDCDLSGSVSTGGGTVKFSRVRGGLRGSSGSGPIIFAQPKDARGGETAGDLGGWTVNRRHTRITNVRGQAQGALHIEKAGGEIELDEAPQGAWVSTGGGPIRVGRGAGTIEASTGGGDIDIGPVAGSVIAGTGAGDVHVTVVDAGKEEQTVEITSGSGRVIVELPATLDAQFDLETAYTEKFGRATHIDSAWKLDRQVTSRWDDREGTPRRYVRARGTIGSGRGLIHIRTVNGDIVVRRGGR